LKKFLVVIAGPTASGKTALAIDVAKHFNTEIISADSRQFFKELNIGTAKPAPEQLHTVKHHFIDFLSVTEDYDAGKFEEEVLKLLDKLFVTKDIVIMTGGSGLYIEAVCNGFDRLPDGDEDIRKQLSELFKKQGIAALQVQLKMLDPEYFSKVDISNPQRLMRAIEVCWLTGKKYSQLRQHGKTKRNFSIIKIGLEVARKILYERINQRVDKMISAGLTDEAKSVFPFRTANPLQTVGYKELFEFFDGKISFEDAIELIKRNTRRYAKRQLTWFRKDREFTWFNPQDVKKIVAHLEEQVEK
jgi:tRNA dimethylallyltransferase